MAGFDLQRSYTTSTPLRSVLDSRHPAAQLFRRSHRFSSLDDMGEAVDPRQIVRSVELDLESGCPSDTFGGWAILIPKVRIAVAGVSPLRHVLRTDASGSPSAAVPSHCCSAHAAAESVWPTSTKRAPPSPGTALIPTDRSPGIAADTAFPTFVLSAGDHRVRDFCGKLTSCTDD